jgi:hypothetical protein
VRVEPGRHDQQLGVEACERGLDEPVERVQEPLVA